MVWIGLIFGLVTYINMCTHSATSQSCKGILKDATPETLTHWSKLQNSNRRDWSKIWKPSDCSNTAHHCIPAYACGKIWGEREPPFAIRNLHQRPGLKTLSLDWHVASCPSRESKGSAASLRASCFSSTWTERITHQHSHQHPFHPVSSRLFLSFSNVFLICLYLLAFFSSHLQNLILQVEVIEVSSPSSESPRPLLAQLQVPVALARGCWQRRPTFPWPVKCLAKAIIFSAYLSNIYPNVSGNWARLTKPTKLLQPW